MGEWESGNEILRNGGMREWMYVCMRWMVFVSRAKEMNMES